MIELYQILENESEAIVNAVRTRVSKDIPSYGRISAPELKQSLEHMLEGLTEYIVTDSPERLDAYFKYLAKLRCSQSFKLSDLLHKQMLFQSVIRERIHHHFPASSPEHANTYFRAVERLEQLILSSVCHLTDAVHQYLRERLAEHENYLDAANADLGVDLSKFILFRG